MKHVVALSGGKDSTALALRLAEVEPREYIYFCTPTGDELPEMVEHWAMLEARLGPITYVRAKLDLRGLIEEFQALPNFRQRWCTRMLKIEPCRAFIKSLGEATLYVGLRADEPTREGVIYGGAVTERYPLREWGWGLEHVQGYLKAEGVSIPRRTDCARCYHQRIGEWWNLWKDHAPVFEDAASQEEDIGHTFRTPGRDTWPVSLRELGKRFDAGDVPRGADVQPRLFDDEDGEGTCRVCSL